MLYVNPLATPYAARVQGLSDEQGRKQLALKELEHYFVYTLLRELRKSLPKEGLIESAATKRMYEELLDDALSQQIAESGQLGLAKQIEEQLRIAEMQSQLATQSRNNTLPNSASAV